MNHLAPPVDGPRRNALIAALPGEARERLERALEPQFMSREQVLYEPGAPLPGVHFPTTAIVSLCYVLADGASDEIAEVGSEGLVGVALVLGGGTTPSRAVVQRAGWAYGLSREHLEAEFTCDSALQHLLLRYVQALTAQVAQLAVCNRHHSIDQQLCRWLLTSIDRQGSDDLVITHERIADRIGVRREGVTEAAGKLQRAGVIRCDRGRTLVIDRAALEARACECYDVVRRESARLAAPGAAAPARRLVALVPRPVPRHDGLDATDGPVRAGHGRPRDVFTPRTAAAHS